MPVKWITPKWEWVDPLKDRQAEKIAQEQGWKAPSDIIESEGNDVDETYRRIAADQKRREELGIKLGVVAASSQPVRTAEPLPDVSEPSQKENADKEE